MKYIKKFEDINNILYKPGDYIIVTSEYLELENEPMIIESKIANDSFNCYFICNEDEGAEVYINEIIRKMEQFEIDAIKYNL